MTGLGNETNRHYSKNNVLKHSKKNKEEELELRAPGNCLRKACNCEMLSPLQVKQMQRNNILESFNGDVSIA
jgi:hypothetical protein